MQATQISSHEGWNAEDKDVHQSLAILKKKDGSNVWQRWTCLEDVRDMPTILANHAIKELEEDVPMLVQRMEARETEGQEGSMQPFHPQGR